MKIVSDLELDEIDLLVVGLGYESRSTHIYKLYGEQSETTVALGYEYHLDKLSYPANRKELEEGQVKIFEGADEFVFGDFVNYCDSIFDDEPKSVLLDITVLSRHRIAMVLDYLLCGLAEGSKISIGYSLSCYVSPPEDTTPVRKVTEIADQFGGLLGDLSKPTSLIIGLGYEKNKALGLSNYLEAGCEFVFIPKSSEKDFECDVRKNNEEFLSQVPEKNVFTYDVGSPYSTYLDLKSLLLSVSEYSRPLVVPLGPKILAAICVILGREMYPDVPVWRVSSEHMEEPVERAANGEVISFSILV